MSLNEQPQFIRAVPPIPVFQGGEIAGFPNLSALNRELLAALKIIDPPVWGSALSNVWIPDGNDFMAILASLERSPMVESAMLFLMGKSWLARVRDIDTLDSSYGCHADVEVALAVAVIAFANRRRK